MSNFSCTQMLKEYLKWLSGTVSALSSYHGRYNWAVSQQFRLLFGCPTSLISDFNHRGKPSCGIVVTCLNTFVILLAQSVCYYRNVLLLYGFWKSSPGCESLLRWVIPSEKTSITTSHVSLCIPWTSLHSSAAVLHGVFRILNDVQHICDFHPSLAKANNLKVEQ